MIERFRFIHDFHCHAIKNKIANHSIQKVQNLGNKKKRSICEALAKNHVCGIFHMRDIRKKRFTQIYKALYGDAMFVSL